MKMRGVLVGGLAGVLFGINLVTRLLVRFAFDVSDTAVQRGSVIMLGLIGLTCLAYTAWSCRWLPPGQWAVEVALGSLVGLLLAILVGPFASAASPFADGAGEFFKQVWQWSGVTIVGALIGFGAMTALGQDYRTQGLRMFVRERGR